MRLTCIYLLAKIVHGRICNHTDVYVDGKFAIDNCVELDFSCPATSTSRAPACRNALLPREVAALGVALATPSAGSVTSLNLRGSPLGPAGVTALAGALTKLTTLSFASCRIGDKGVKAITKSLLEGESQVLQRLDLAHNSVSDDGVRPLATAFKRDNSLQVLDLSWNAIGQRGGRYLGEALKESHNLLELRLSFNGVADRGARSLGEALGVNSALRLLNLEHNSIKEEGGRALAKGLRTNGALRTLLLDGNGLSNATLLEAAAALVAAPELPSPTTSASERASDTRRASAMSDEDIEEISFDDDVDATAEAAAEAAAEYTEEPLEEETRQSIRSSSSAAVRAPASAHLQYSDPKLTDAQKKALLVPIDTGASSGSLEARMAFKLREYSVLRAELGAAEANKRASLSPERRAERSNRTSKEGAGVLPSEAPPVAAPSAADAQDDANGAVTGARMPLPPGGTASERRRGRITSIGSPRAVPTASAPPRRPLRASPERGAAAGAPPQRPAGVGGGRPRSQQTPRGRKDGD